MSAIMLGMPTLIELEGLEDNVELCRELGLEFVELNMNLPGFGPGVLGADRVRAISDKAGVGFTVHLPEEIDLASCQAAMREGNLNCCTEAIRWAGDFGARLVNIHIRSGVYFSLPDRRVWIYEQYQGRFVAALADSFRQLGEVARESGVTVCIENGDFALGFIQVGLEQVLNENGDWLKLTWDVGHDAGAGYGHRPVFEKFRDRIGHIHLHDWNGKANHQVLFSGEVDIAKFLKLAEELGVGVVIETKTAEALRESVRRLDERGLR